jgi:hypothetical protein
MDIEGYALQYFERAESLVDIDYPDGRHFAHRTLRPLSASDSCSDETATLSTLGTRFYMIT